MKEARERYSKFFMFTVKKSVSYSDRKGRIHRDKQCLDTPEERGNSIVKRTAIKQFLNHYFCGLFRRIGEHHTFLLGRGLAFSILICMIPLVLIIFSVLGNILEVSSVEQQLNFFIDRIIPYANHASLIKKIIFSQVEEVIAYKNLVGYLGILGLLYATSTLFSTMRTALNTIYRVGGYKRMILGKLQDLGMVLVVLAFFLISTAILPILEIIKDSADEIVLLRIFRFSPLERVIIFIGSFLIIFLLFFIVYYLIPYIKLSKRVTAISALWAAILWEIAKQAFGLYINNFASLGKIYGTYVLIVVVVFWIYYSSVIFLLGAEIGQLYRERIKRIGQ